MKTSINWGNFKAYVQGNVRNYLFYSKRLSFLLPLHVFEQINYRLFIMDKECYSEGSCRMCGCNTPALQMANKACPKPCYPEMMDDTDWFIFKTNNSIEFRYWRKDKPREFELRITHKTYME
jgi:hypothetical protein